MISWSVWNWDTGTVYVEKRICLLDWDIQRPKPLHWWLFAWQRCLSPKRWDGEFYKRWEIARNNIKHRGNSCAKVRRTITHADEFSFPWYPSQLTTGSGIDMFAVNMRVLGRTNSCNWRKAHCVSRSATSWHLVHDGNNVQHRLFVFSYCRNIFLIEERWTKKNQSLFRIG